MPDMPPVDAGADSGALVSGRFESTVEVQLSAVPSGHLLGERSDVGSGPGVQVRAGERGHLRVITPEGPPADIRL